MIDELMPTNHSDVEVGEQVHPAGHNGGLDNAKYSSTPLRSRALDVSDYTRLRTEFERLADLPADVRNSEIRQLGWSLELRHRLVSMLVFDDLMHIEPERRECNLQARLLPDALRDRIQLMIEDAYVRIYGNARSTRA